MLSTLAVMVLFYVAGTWAAKRYQTETDRVKANLAAIGVLCVAITLAQSNHVWVLLLAPSAVGVYRTVRPAPADKTKPTTVADI